MSAARPVIGGVGALMALLFLGSGVLHIGVLSPALVLALAFIAGFSERLVLRGVEALAAPTS